jgi:hypothetical protein
MPINVPRLHAINAVTFGAFGGWHGQETGVGAEHGRSLVHVRVVIVPRAGVRYGLYLCRCELAPLGDGRLAGDGRRGRVFDFLNAVLDTSRVSTAIVVGRFLLDVAFAKVKTQAIQHG